MLDLEPQFNQPAANQCSRSVVTTSARPPARQETARAGMGMSPVGAPPGTALPEIARQAGLVHPDIDTAACMEYVVSTTASTRLTMATHPRRNTLCNAVASNTNITSPHSGMGRELTTVNRSRPWCISRLIRRSLVTSTSMFHSGNPHRIDCHHDRFPLSGISMLPPSRRPASATDNGVGTWGPTWVGMGCIMATV